MFSMRNNTSLVGVSLPLFRAFLAAEFISVASRYKGFAAVLAHSDWSGLVGQHHAENELYSLKQRIEVPDKIRPVIHKPNMVCRSQSIKRCHTLLMEFLLFFRKSIAY